MNVQTVETKETPGVLPADGKTPRPLDVRLATISDEEAALELMCIAQREQPIFTLNYNKIRGVIQRCTRPQAAEGKFGALALIDGPDGTLEGYLLMLVTQHWFTDDWHVDEISNFVRPDIRKVRPGHARKLINFAKWFAEAMDMPLIMGILTTKRLEAKIKLYGRQLIPAGCVFVHNTGHGKSLTEMG